MNTVFMRTAQSLLLVFLFGWPTAMLTAQERPLGPSSSPIPPAAQKIGYSVLRVYQPAMSSPGGGPLDKVNQVKQAAKEVPVQDGEIIDTPEQYAKLFGTPPANVDWKTMRVYAVEELSVYKLGQLESTTTLADVYRSGSAIYVVQTSTQYGPCQGIAQQPEWFSFERRILLLLIPRLPEKIVRVNTEVGGCPPDIP